MNVFVSYSTKDEKFVNRVTEKLIQNKIVLWKDNWEMIPGDELETKIAEAIERAAFLLLVLSKNSIKSNWCIKELELAFQKEERLTDQFIIPIIIDDRTIPEGLENRIFADFRESFEKGINSLLQPLSELYLNSARRNYSSEYHMDYAIDYYELHGHFHLQIDLVQVHNEKPISILVQTFVRGDEKASQLWKKQVENGYEDVMSKSFIAMMKNSEGFLKKQIRLKNDYPYEESFFIQDEKLSISFAVFIRARILGNNYGFDILFDYGSLVTAISAE